MTIPYQGNDARPFLRNWNHIKTKWRLHDEAVAVEDKAASALALAHGHDPRIGTRHRLRSLLGKGRGGIEASSDKRIEQPKLLRFGILHPGRPW